MTCWYRVSAQLVSALPGAAAGLPVSKVRSAAIHPTTKMAWNGCPRSSCCPPGAVTKTLTGWLPCDEGAVRLSVTVALPPRGTEEAMVAVAVPQIRLPKPLSEPATHPAGHVVVPTLVTVTVMLNEVPAPTLAGWLHTAQLAATCTGGLPQAFRSTGSASPCTPGSQSGCPWLSGCT